MEVYILIFELKALGDESRWAIIKLLSIKGELCGCEIESYFSISQSTVSHHMKILVMSNLVKERKIGRSHYYSLDKKTVNDLILSIQKIL